MKYDESELRLLESQSAPERLGWVVERAGGSVVLTTSFGVQSAVLLHMVSRVVSDVPVVFIDTGFLFDETYQFAASLQERLGLNLQVYHPRISARRLVATRGELWTQGEEGLQEYNQVVKVEPMRRALEELAPAAWISGLRRQQSDSRRSRGVVEEQWGITKAYPVIDWTDRDIYQYLKTHDLPFHPLWEEGYVSVGDYHSSTQLHAGESHETTRFGGVKRECGLHEDKRP